MAQCWIVGGGSVGCAVSPQRFPRLLATGCALHGASLSRVWSRERHQREGRSGVGLVACSPRFPRRVVAGCALHGASLSLAWPRESNQREGHPDIRVSLRETPLPPVPLRGPAYKGRRGPLSLARHPCLASPSTTPALGLLTGTVARTKLLRLIVPTLRVGTPLQTLRVCGTRSVPGWVPTQSVGAIGTIGVCTAF